MIIKPVGDAAAQIFCGLEISEEIGGRVAILAAAIEKIAAAGVGGPSGITEVIPAFSSLLVRYDSLHTDYSAVKSLLEVVITQTDFSKAGEIKGDTVEIPVCYGGEYGPDLSFVAENAGLSEAEVISLHSGTAYRLYMLGFLPGFPYLGGLDSRLHSPRLKTPRTAIPVGSVGIGGEQTGIYPLASPGGWRLIGRTPLTLFDPGNGILPPYKAGDMIKFVPISEAEFERVASEKLRSNFTAGSDHSESPRFTKRSKDERGAEGAAMPLSAMKIISPGPLATIQDRGRLGYQSQGYRESGAADLYALAAANILVGNPDPYAAALEITLGGAVIEFASPAVFAISGADVPLALDGVKIAAYAPHYAKVGSKLNIGFAASGLRAYLAVLGGVATPPALGSRSTDTVCKIGGHQGRKLQAGDGLPLGGEDYENVVENRRRYLAAKKLLSTPAPDALTTPLSPKRFIGDEKIPLLRAVLGPQEEYFTDSAIKTFFREIFTLSGQSDRMGARLTGPAIETKNGSDIISDGIAFGSVQIASDGRPIVMLADHQTTGGYAKIATVISADLPIIAQLRPGEKIGFQPVAADEAAEIARRREIQLQQLQKIYGETK